MFYILGLLISASSILISIQHLKQNVLFYFDFVAVSVVFGGTAAVALVILPWEYWFDILVAVKRLLSPQARSFKALATECMYFIHTRGQISQEMKQAQLPSDVLKDGEELISLGFKPDKVELILTERIHQRTASYHTIANALRSLAKYPPAFGLVGTVLGLVSLMRAVSDGAPPKEVGIRMAVALLATFYGLLVSNLIISPAGENLMKLATEEKKQAELALQAVLLMAENVTLLEAQEVLNSFVPRVDRVNVLSELGLSSTEENAA
ncbi:MAG: motility protein A [Bdellovibrionia bacterium]